MRPASRQDALAWDPWRSRWIVSCRAPPRDGQANRAVLHLMAGWLGRPPSAARWLAAGSSKAKLLEVEGLSDDEADGRLRSLVRTLDPTADS